MSGTGPDLFRLDGRTVFVSGAAGHLGRAMCWALGKAGARLILNGRNAVRLEFFADELRATRIQASCAAFDMTDLIAVRDFFARQDELHVLINNAISMTPKAFDSVQADDFDLAYRSGVVAGFEAVRAARPALTRAADAGGASVVNVGSMYGLVSPDVRLYSQPGQMSPPHYGAAKAALLQLTRHLAGELGPSGIRVNALCPGPFPRGEVLQNDPAFGTRLAERTMLRRTGHAHEIAGPVLFLASPASSYMTGAVLTADGGWTAW